VLAFNYNTNGSYEFWDSKSGTSMTGTKAAANFATGIALNSEPRKTQTATSKAWMGELKIFNYALDSTRVCQRTNCAYDQVGSVAPTPAPTNDHLHRLGWRAGIGMAKRGGMAVAGPDE